MVGMYLHVVYTWLFSLFVAYPVPGKASQRSIVFANRGVGRQWHRAIRGHTGLQLLLYPGLLSTVALAQFAAPANTRLTTANGLPHNTVTGIVQDRAGFIWIATYDGLARYDGRSITVFRNRPGDSHSLIDNKITQLEPATDGTFLIVTGSGNFQRFDPRTEQFTTLLDERFLARRKVPVSDGHLTADGQHLWGLLPGIRLIDYDLHQKTLRVYDLPALVGGPNEVDDFCLTRTGYIYGMATTGLFQFDTRTGRKRLIPYPFPPLTKLQTANFFPTDGQQIVECSDGQVAYFGYQVIVLYDPVRNRSRAIPIPDAVPNEQVFPFLKGVAQRNTVSFALRTLADNRLYVGYLNRLYRLDAGGQLVRLYPPGQPTGDVTPWLLDRSAVLWTGSESAGLNRLDFHALPFGFAPKRKSFAEDLIQQDLGMALPDSFQLWDVPRWPRYTIGPNKMGYLIDPLRVYRHRFGDRHLTELPALWITNGQICCKLCMKVTPTGRIWFYSNERGLVESDLAGSRGRLYPNSQLPLVGPKPGHDAGDIQPLGRSVWVGARFGLGLFRYDIGRQRFDKPFVNNPNSANSLAGNSIFCLSADPADSTVLWIGTAGSGLCRLDTRTMTFRRFGEAEGFPNGTIQSIEADNQGQLWIGTNRGLVRLNRPVGGTAGTPQTLTWRHFTTDDGLAENEFLRLSSARLPDGRLVFGTPNGRIIFDPRAIRDDGYEPPVVLTSLLINNKPDSRTVNRLSELVLDHTQNFLTIGFAGLHYGKADKLKYRYQLTGVDANWVTAVNQNTANYTQLAPGHYVFRVNSTTADGRWSRQVKQLTIVITPPFWATWWAYGAYALAFGGLVLGFIRFRIGQARQRQEVLQKRREAEQLRAVDEVKTRFFSNITHEFRTPLTLILSPTAKLLTNPGYDVFTRQTLTTVYQNAGQLLRLINQLLDLSKLEGGNMNVALSRGDVVTFVQCLVDLFQPMADSRGIALHLEINGQAGNRTTGEPVPLPAYRFDADKWEKIITNLLSNALKFTPTGGQVSLTLEPPRFAGTTLIETMPGRNAGRQLVLTIADTGIGIPAQHIAHIFDRFYQADDSRTRAYEGTGIGLALVKELTDLLGGTISVQSRTRPGHTEADRSPGTTGTTFTLTLPLLPDTHEEGGPELVLPDRAVIHDPVPLTDTPATPTVADDAPLVLVVDDNDELRTFVASELANRYRVLTAADGQEGWEICQRELPDVVVSDVMMPRLDGYQLTHCIKSTLATNHIAVVLLTAKAAHQSRIIGLEQGADDYLTKPFHTDELVLRLNNLLTRQANLRAFIHRQLSSLMEEPDAARPNAARPDATERSPARPNRNDEPAARPVADAFVSQLHQAIESRLDDATFGVDDLAGAVAMSRRTLHRKLTATTSLSALDFIRHYRLQRATQLLRTGRSIAETAYDVGFESPAYFTKVFRQTYQQTPSEFLSR